jgi:hypothetical protein
MDRFYDRIHSMSGDFHCERKIFQVREISQYRSIPREKIFHDVQYSMIGNIPRREIIHDRKYRMKENI